MAESVKSLKHRFLNLVTNHLSKLAHSESMSVHKKGFRAKKWGKDANLQLEASICSLPVELLTLIYEFVIAGKHKTYLFTSNRTQPWTTSGRGLENPEPPLQEHHRAQLERWRGTLDAFSNEPIMITSEWEQWIAGASLLPLRMSCQRLYHEVSDYFFANTSYVIHNQRPDRFYKSASPALWHSITSLELNWRARRRHETSLQYRLTLEPASPTTPPFHLVIRNFGFAGFLRAVMKMESLTKFYALIGMDILDQLSLHERTVMINIAPQMERLKELERRCKDFKIVFVARSKRVLNKSEYIMSNVPENLKVQTNFCECPKTSRCMARHVDHGSSPCKTRYWCQARGGFLD